MEPYEELLKRALQQVPKITFDRSRFQVPEPDIVYIGNRTIIRNFKGICSALNRDEKHLMKYLLRELGAAGNQSGEQLVVQGKFAESSIKQKIDLYLEEFIFCRECRRPDTKLIKHEGITVLQCEACGAKTTVRTI
jgi:translation initiation factor 2 subunit 2